MGLGWVCVGVGAEFLSRLKIYSLQMVQTGVLSPYSEKCMCQISEITLHGKFLGRRSACCQISHADLVCKDLEVSNWVGDDRELWREGKTGI